MVAFLEEGNNNVSYVSKLLQKVDYSNVKKYIKKLEEKGFLTSKREGKYKLVFLTDKAKRFLQPEEQKLTELEEIVLKQFLRYRKLQLKQLLNSEEIQQLLRKKYANEILKYSADINVSIIPKKIKQKMKLYLVSVLERLTKRQFLEKETKEIRETNKKQVFYSITKQGIKVLEKLIVPEKEIFDKSKVIESNSVINFEGHYINPKEVLRNFSTIKEFLNSLEGGYRLYKFKNYLYAINHRYKLFFEIEKENERSFFVSLIAIKENRGDNNVSL